MPGMVSSEAPTVSLSFANNFWGKDDAGVSPLLERMHGAKVTSDELKSFYNTRAAIEEEYARKLLALCRKPLGSCETGTLRASLDVTRGEVEAMGKAHQNIAQQMKTELEEPLAAFAGGMKERRKIVQGGIEKLLKVKVQQTQLVNKTRDKYEQDCLKIKGYLAQGHMVMGQEERKNKAKLEKTQIQLASASSEYETAVKALEETTGRWNRDWKVACDKFQDLEEERLDFTKSSLWTFANIASTVCVTDDASCEKIRLSLENCEVEKDITSFIKDRGTGQEIPDPPKYINFCRGDVNDTASEVSEDESYSVAQFQRSMNPAFRTSSPQPSTLESHHDPNSDLAAQMGLSNGNTPTPRGGASRPQIDSQPKQPPPPLNYQQGPAQLQAQEVQAKFQSQQIELARVPHNEYPSDGMTMFCRTDGASDRSSVVSPVRPSSSDSKSEYSNPTSFSSVEPASGKTSPVKQMGGQYSQPVSPTKAIAKKKSGFFSNSPFRRKSKHEKERSQSQAPTTSRWGGDKSSTSTSRHGVDSRDFANNEDNEPVDPRASFQLNVGNNVFDVASPEKQRKPPLSPTKGLSNGQGELDPIAAALEELKGVTKQSSVRVSADRYHGIATPAPGQQVQYNTAQAAAQRGTPPPGYNDPGVRRLDAPQPAHTSASMRATTQRYAGQNADMYGSNSRPGTGSSMPRSASPLPIRSVSPRPDIQRGQPQQQQNYNRAPSPNPYANGSMSGRSGQPQQYRQNTGMSSNGSPHKSRGYGDYSPGNSPGEVHQAASPQPQYAQRNDGMRPSSSNGQGQGGMAMQLSQNDIQVHPHQGGQGYPQQRRGPPSQQGQGQGRPVSYYGGGGSDLGPNRGAQQDYGGQQGQVRPRSKSMAGDGRQFTREGRVILHFARALYAYTAAIPEELSFAKGDMLAVLRLQDDGWWEAEVTGKGKGRPGLVPSNYLQAV